ncbi:MAG: ABC transporter permease subunit [Candidatus Omnitrophota bacterium]
MNSQNLDEELMFAQDYVMDEAAQQRRYWLSILFSGPRVVNNPIIMRELLSRLRGVGSFVFLGVFIATCSFAFCAIWQELQNTPDGWLLESRRYFLLFNVCIGGAICLTVPLLGATCFNIEHERRTWEMLLAAPLNLSAILLGKLISSIAFAVLALTSIIPLYGMFATVAKTSYAELIFSVLFLFEAIGVMGLIGLYCSIEFKKSWLAIIAAYLFALAYFQFFILPLGTSGGGFAAPLQIVQSFAPIAAAPSAPAVAAPVAAGLGFLTINPQINPAVVSISAVQTNSIFAALIVALIGFGPYTAASNAVYVQIISFYAALFGYFISRFFFFAILLSLCLWTMARKLNYDFFEAIGQVIHEEALRIKPIYRLRLRREAWLPDGRNPVRLKEVREFFGRKSLLLLTWMGFLAILSPILLVRYSSFDVSILGVKRLILWRPLLEGWTAALIPFLVLPYAANAVRREVNHGTWEQLLSTALGPWRIVLGKIGAGMQWFSLQFWAFFAIFILVGFSSRQALSPEAAINRQMIWNSLIFAYASGLFLLSAGLAASATLRNTAAAYGLCALIGAVHLLGGGYFSLPDAGSFAVARYVGLTALASALLWFYCVKRLEKTVERSSAV